MDRKGRVRMARSHSIPAIHYVLLIFAGMVVAVGGESDYAEVVKDHFMGMNIRSGSRFLKVENEEALKKGQSCDPVTKNICPGVRAKNETQLLFCCKTHCRDVLTDRNNCGSCGVKCSFGQLCCEGVCTAVAYDVNNCGKCGNVCRNGNRCEYGNCGYA